ncbi:MAG: PhnA domain-containing protein [Pseudomonadota bacterium]|nr:PhnA domain-containing protein [Pseudomonadota bacterium]
MSDLLATLGARAGGICELCGHAPDPAAPTARDLGVYSVPPVTTADAARAVLVCGVCRAQIDGESPLDAKHWFCLQQAAWSEVPAVQVVSWRLLQRLDGEGWARELLDQVYLDDEVLAWARETGEVAAEAQLRVVDSNGAVLSGGDTVTVIKDLDVKGTSFTAKRGTVVKNIRLTDDPALVEGRVNGIEIFLKTCFLKKVG